MGPKMPIYLDNQATTPCDPRVVEAMLPYFTERFGNPHSSSHAYGWQAEEATELAREQVAAILNADPKGIVFTSGATEANNLAIKGTAQLFAGRKDHLVTVATEHKCVLESFRWLERQGFSVTTLPVEANGLVDLARLEAALTERTALVSVMAVNNEIGVIQPIAEIGALCRARGIVFHTDAAQAVGKIPLDVAAMNIDLLSVSGHKIYGPKGIGALYVRRRPRLRIVPQMSGGEQERGLRAGTVPTPLCVGLGEACRLAQAEMPAESARLRILRDRLRDGLLAGLPGVTINGDMERRIPGNLNVSFGYVEGDVLIKGITEVAASSGSACSSGSVEPSYVLRALGLDAELAHASLRFGLGRFTTADEIERAIGHLVTVVGRAREESPLWQMHREGIDLKSIHCVGE